jgi:hypothetical protein
LGLGASSQASAQAKSFTVGLFGGLGGSTDSEFDSDVDNAGFQALFSAKIAQKTRFSIRAGSLDLETDDLFDNQLDYITLTGEYRFDDSYYESGLFLGLGVYDLSGDVFEDETSIGLTVGVNGEFRFHPRWSVMVEVSGHYADLDQANLFLMGHVGLAFDF